MSIDNIIKKINKKRIKTKNMRKGKMNNKRSQ